MQTPCLVTNDDGIDSPGLRELAAAAVRSDLDVVVAAPDLEASGSSAALTARSADGKIMLTSKPLAGLPVVRAYAVPASPAFIAFTGVRGAFGTSPEVLLSGINRGPNTGRAVPHSGTVGAALTAALFGVRAAAFSLDWRDGPDQHWDTAAAVAEQILPGLPNQRPGVVLNVNVPNVPRRELRGIRHGALAATGAFQPHLINFTEEYLRVTTQETRAPAADGSDAALVAAGFASVTALVSLCEVTPADGGGPAFRILRTSLITPRQRPRPPGRRGKFISGRVPRHQRQAGRHRLGR